MIASNEAGVKLMSVGIFGPTTRIDGEIRVHQRRLSDYLNALETSFILLDNAKVTSLADPQAQPRAFAFAQVSRDTVICAIPYSGEPQITDEQQKRLMIVPKLPFRVLLTAPPFLIRGNLHLLKAADLRAAVLGHRQAFLPLTNATAIYQPTGRRFEAAALIVNRLRIELLCPGEER